MPDPETGGTEDIEREVDRLSGEFLEGRVPSADAPPPWAAPPGTAPVDAAAQADANAQLAVDVVVSTMTQTPLDKPGPRAQVSGDGLRTVAGMTTHAPAALAAGSGAGGGRALAVAGMAIVALAAFIGALLALQGGSGGAAPSVPGGSGAVAQVSGRPASGPPSVSPTPTAAPTSTATPTSPATPTPDASAAEPEATPGGAPAAGSSITLRGTLDVAAIEKAGLDVGNHDLELVVFPDTGEVTGTVVLEIPAFPIGALLTATFGGQDDPDFAEFKKCEVVLTMQGDVTGTYTPATGALKGKVAFRPETDDTRGCLATRPKNLSIDKAVKASTVKWSGTLRGTKASGKLALDPPTKWSATAE